MLSGVTDAEPKSTALTYGLAEKYETAAAGSARLFASSTTTPFSRTMTRYVLGADPSATSTVRLADHDPALAASKRRVATGVPARSTSAVVAPTAAPAPTTRAIQARVPPSAK